MGGLPLAVSAKQAEKTWDVVELPILSETSPILFDIEFDSQDPQKGWVVGNRGTFLQTTNGGKTWVCLLYTSPSPRD